jgi:hypothetical protein
MEASMTSVTASTPETKHPVEQVQRFRQMFVDGLPQSSRGELAEADR